MVIAPHDPFNQSLERWGAYRIDYLLRLDCRLDFLVEGETERFPCVHSPDSLEDGVERHRWHELFACRSLGGELAVVLEQLCERTFVTRSNILPFDTGIIRESLQDQSRCEQMVRRA